MRSTAPAHGSTKEQGVKYFLLFNPNSALYTMHHIHDAQTVGSAGETTVFRWGWRKYERDYGSRSAWATVEDGRWLSTAVLKRQNVARSSDRCSFITAPCQHLEWRTVVIFESDPGLVMFWQHQSFSEWNKSSIYIDLTSNYIHGCGIRTDLCLKIQDKWAAVQKSCSSPPEHSVLLPGFQEPKSQWCSLFSPLFIIKLPVFRITLRNQRENSSKCSHSQNYCFHLLIHHHHQTISMVKTHQPRVFCVKTATGKINSQRKRKRDTRCSCNATH